MRLISTAAHRGVAVAAVLAAMAWAPAFAQAPATQAAQDETGAAAASQPGAASGPASQPDGGSAASEPGAPTSGPADTNPTGTAGPPGDEEALGRHAFENLPGEREEDADAQQDDGEIDDGDEEDDEQDAAPENLDPGLPGRGNSPAEPGDVPVPPGYAPRTPQVFLTGPRLWVAQYVAGLGAHTMASWLQWVPVLGPLAMLLAPGFQAAAVVYAGDRLGPYRGSLFWPVTVAYLSHVLGNLALLTVGALGYGLLLVGVPVMTVAGLGGAGGVLSVPLLVVGGAMTLAGVAVVVVAAVGSVLLQYAGAPAAVLAAYHLSRQVKRADDNGTGLPRLLPRGKGLPLPGGGPRRFLGGEPQDDENADNNAPPLPVGDGGGP